MKLPKVVVSWRGPDDLHPEPDGVVDSMRYDLARRTTWRWEWSPAHPGVASGIAARKGCPIKRNGDADVQDCMLPRCAVLRAEHPGV